MRKSYYRPDDHSWFVPGEREGELQVALNDAVKRHESTVYDWVLQAKKEAQNGAVSRNTLDRLSYLQVEKFPEMRQKLSEAIEQAKQKRQQSKAARVQKVSARRLYPLSNRPSLGEPVRIGGQLVVFTEAGQKFRLDESHPSLHGSHLLGHEGELGAYFYYRPATEVEATAYEAAEAAKAGQKVKAAETAAIINAAKDYVQQNGEMPQGPVEPEGQRYHDTQNLYGGGDWFVVGPEWIWYVRNNGMDGDAWENNNVRTGGAGAIGWRVPYSAELAEKITGTA